ncbi:MAG: J domain-containing protein [Hyphomicrobiales bacterium]|nr:J domain-containing protein [Hyphomicrobiales bacterium]MDE2115680.1 DnaJ domain-containing protein [Hyphomicrobiales bacterium]
MESNSRLFDRIRIHPDAPEVAQPDEVRCDHVGCQRPGEFRAPMGRDHEGQYFCFCVQHVREYNASYNYFNGMSDDAIARYQKDAIIGHRPTWSMGVNRAAKGHREEGMDTAEDTLGLFKNRFAHKRAAREPHRPRQNGVTLRSLHALGLDEGADAVTIKNRYKQLVKRLHPDANGGDRSSEDKLREIINAYNYLKGVKLA